MFDLPAEKRDEAVRACIDQIRRSRHADLFQRFCIRQLPGLDYSAIAGNSTTADLGCDALATAPDGTRCIVSVSFDASPSKILADWKMCKAKGSAPNAKRIVFMTWRSSRNTSITNRTIKTWEAEIRKMTGLELAVIHEPDLLRTSTRNAVWTETCEQLGITYHRDGFHRISPYDSDRIRSLLNVRPKEILDNPLPRRELQGRNWERSCLFVGKPGAGKTTAIFQALEALRPCLVLVVGPAFGEYSQAERLVDALRDGGGVLVFDDIWERPEAFKTFWQVLRACQVANTTILASIRSTEWDPVQAVVPSSCFEDLGLTGDGVLSLGELSLDECRTLVERCRDQWQLDMEERLIDIAARTAYRGDASPLYVISILAEARGRPDRRVVDADFAGVPKTVVGKWSEHFGRLGSESRAVLRIVKLFSCAGVEAETHLLTSAAGDFGLKPYQVNDALGALERALWVSRSEGLKCLDAQLEAVSLAPEDYDTWDAYVMRGPGTRETHLALLNGTGCYYAQVRRAKAGAEQEQHRAIHSGLAHFCKALALTQDGKARAAFFNNASILYGELAELEPTREARVERLQEAVKAVEEAAGLYRQLGLLADLAASLSNASGRHAELAELEPTREARVERLQQAVKAVEESVRIRRQLGLQADLSHSLNNASNLYGGLAELEPTREARVERLQEAVKAVEEAVSIRRQLGLQADLAASLSNASGCYGELANEAGTADRKRKFLEQALGASGKAVSIFRQAGDSVRFLITLGKHLGDLVSFAALTGRTDLGRAIALCEEGVAVATKYGDRDRAKLFSALKASLERGELPDLG